jgi:hypothetical protein
LRLNRRAALTPRLGGVIARTPIDAPRNVGGRLLGVALAYWRVGDGGIPECMEPCSDPYS